MTYSPQTWHDLPAVDTPILASRLGYMENGIAGAHAAAAVAQATANAALAAATAVPVGGTGGDPTAIIGLALDGTTDDGLIIQAALEQVEDGARGTHLVVRGDAAGQVAYINSTITISRSGTILDFEVPVLAGPDFRIRPWGIIAEEPVDFNVKPALTADALAGATVLNLDAIPSDWAAGIYVGIRGNRTSSGVPLSNQIFFSYVTDVNVGALTITLADPLPEDYLAVNPTSWSNKESQVTKVIQSKMTGTPDRGDVTINLDDASIFQVGDVVRAIDDTETVSGNPVHKEMALVAEVLSGTALKLSHPLYHSFDTGANARLEKMTALEDVEIRNLRATWDAQGTSGTHAIEVRYAHNVHLINTHLIGGGDAGVSWSGHGIRFTDSLACSAVLGTISNPSDVGPGLGYGVSFYGSSLCSVESMHIAGTRHAVLWFAGASGNEARGVISTDCRISDFDWHGAECNNNRTTSCTAVGGTRNTTDSSVRSAWKFGNPAHQANDRGNVATDCLVVNYVGVAVEAMPACSENSWQGIVKGAATGIKVLELPLDDAAILGGLTVRDSEFWDVTAPLEVDGGPNSIVEGLVIDNNRWHRSGPFTVIAAPGARFTNNVVVDPTGTGYVFTATDCDNIMVKGNDFSGAAQGIQLTGCPAARVVRNDLHDLTSTTVVLRDGGSNTGFAFLDNRALGYTPTRSNAGTPSAGTVELVPPTSGGGGGGTYPPSGGVPYSDLDTALQALVSGAYQLPGTGIPESDLAAAVSTSLGLADTAYQKPALGIPNSDLETPGGGVDRSWDSADEHAYNDWAFDVTIAQQSAAATAGRLEMTRVRIRSTGTRTKVVYSVATAASGLTAAYAAVYDAATGNLLAVTADIASSLTSTGVKSLSTAASYTTTAGSDVYLAILQVGGTPAALHRAVTSAGLGNAGLNAGAGYRFMSSGSGLTSAPSTVTISGGTSSSSTFWCAIS